MESNPVESGGSGGGGGPLPKNWPADVPFLRAPHYSPALTSTHLSAIRIPPLASNPKPNASPSQTQLPTTTATPIIPRNFPRGPNPSVEIRLITDPSHPAFGQAGLFATTRLEPGTLILPYLGELHPGGGARAAAGTTISGEEDEDGGGGGKEEKSDYDLWLSRDADVAVDAARMGNEARFVNDYRGVPGKMRANAEFRDVWDCRWRHYLPDQNHPDSRSAGPTAEAGSETSTRTQQLPPGRKGGRRTGTGEWGMAVFVMPVGKKALAKSGGRPVGGIEEGEEILVSYGKGFWEKGRAEEEQENQVSEQEREGG